MTVTLNEEGQLAREVGAVLAAARVRMYGERSRGEVARTLGWDATNLLRVERGEDNPTLERLERVVIALGGYLRVKFAAHESGVRDIRSYNVLGHLSAQVGTVLALARGNRTRQELAARLGCRPVSLLRVERGEDNPTLRRLERIAAAYGGRLRMEFVGPHRGVEGP